MISVNITMILFHFSVIFHILWTDINEDCGISNFSPFNMCMFMYTKKRVMSKWKDLAMEMLLAYQDLDLSLYDTRFCN